MKKITPITTAIAALLAAGLLATGLLTTSACSDPADRQFDRAQMLEDTGQGVIMQTNDELLQASTALGAAAETFCADRTDANLALAREAWLDVKKPLKRLEALNFGPYKVFGIAVAKSIDKWPGRADNIEQVLASDDEIDQAFIEGLPYTDRVKGYPALGYMLYGTGDASTTLEAYGAEAPDGDRRCAYLTALTEHAGAVVAAYHAKWAADGENYIGEFVTAGRGSDAFGSEQAALEQYVGSMTYALDQIAMMKLGEPLGNNDGGTPVPENVEAPYSETSIDHALWTLEGVENLYLGKEGGESLSDYVQFREAAGGVDQSMRDRLQAAKAALEAIPRPLSEAVVDSPDKVQAAIDAVDAVNRVLSGDVSTLLGINPTNVEGDND